MSYKGQTFVIPCNTGGLVPTSNHDVLGADSMVPGTKNLNYSSGGREKRGGTRKVNANNQIANAPDSLGSVQYIKDQSSKFIITYDSNGLIWSNYTTNLGNMTAGLTPNFEFFNHKIYIVNGADIPRKWDGIDTTLEALTLIPTDWVGSNQPKWLINHGRGNNRKLYAGGCANNTDIVYISGFDTDDASAGTEPNFSDSCMKILKVLTKSGYGIIGAVEFGQQLMFFTKNKTFILDDNNTDWSMWGIYSAPWEAGVASDRLIVRTPNDVICMTDNGDVYSIAAVNTSNDYQTASLARPAFMDIWMRENLDLTAIDKFHAVYDPALRVVRFFVIRNGQSSIDTCLLYFIDRKPLDAWMIHDNLSYASGFNAASSTLVEVSTGNYKVYTGDYNGYIWELEYNKRSDDGNGYYAGFTTPQILLNAPRDTKLFDRGWIAAQSFGTYIINIEPKIDGVALTAQTITTKGAGTLWNAMKWNQFYWASSEQIIDKSFQLGAKGRRLQLKVYNDTANQRMFISQIHIDFESIYRGID